jgi:hypothetical protein
MLEKAGGRGRNPATRNLYHYNIKNLQLRGNKAVVLISDAMRYEIGEELVNEINSQQDTRHQSSLCLHQADIHSAWHGISASA